MTYWSRIWRISCGVGSLFRSARAASLPAPSSRMMSLQSSMHSSQINTEGPAISLRTSCWLLPQKEQYKSLSPADLSAMGSETTFHRLIVIVMLSRKIVSDPFRVTLRGSHPFLQDLVDDPILFRRFGPQEIVTIMVALDLLLRTTGELRH